MSAKLSSRYAHPRHQQEVDGGDCGPLRVSVADGTPGVPPAIFVDSEWLTSSLRLSADQATELGEALMAASERAES